MVYTCNLSTPETDVGGIWVQSQGELHRDYISKTRSLKVSMSTYPYTLPLFKLFMLIVLVSLCACFIWESIKNWSHNGITSKLVSCSTSKYVSSEHFIECRQWVYKKNNGLVFRDFIYLCWWGLSLSVSISEDLFEYDLNVAGSCLTAVQIPWAATEWLAFGWNLAQAPLPPVWFSMWIVLPSISVRFLVNTFWTLGELTGHLLNVLHRKHLGIIPFRRESHLWVDSHISLFWW